MVVHYHSSYMPPRAAGFKDRGCIREGMAGEVTFEEGKDTKAYSGKLVRY
jgi:hypothetical protein